MQKTTAGKILVMTSSLFILLALGLLWTMFLPSQVSAGFTPTATSDGGSDGGEGDSGGDGDLCRQGAIFGSVTDLCLGEPGRGVQVEINGNIVTTDGDGRFSLTGLSPGTYHINVLVAGEWQPGSTTVSIGVCGQVVNVGLNYNSCPVPTPTATPTAIFYLPETGNKDSAGIMPLVLILFVTGLLMLAVGVGWHQSRE